MPVIQVNMREGRSPEIKKKIAAAIADAMAEHAGSNRDGVFVLFYDMPQDNFVHGFQVPGKFPPPANSEE